MNKICGGAIQPVKVNEAGEKAINHISAFFGRVHPEGVKRIRAKCPQCGRKVKTSVHYCHDGCCIIHVIPPHKVKGWWKK